MNPIGPWLVLIVIVEPRIEILQALCLWQELGSQGLAPMLWRPTLTASNTLATIASVLNGNIALLVLLGNLEGVTRQSLEDYLQAVWPQMKLLQFPAPLSDREAEAQILRHLPTARVGSP